MRRRELRRRGLPRRQRGVALIIAMILVALAAILATKLTFDGWMERRRTTSVLAGEQALHFAFGAEALAADVLAQNQPGGDSQVTLAQPWAQPTQPLPLTAENDAEGEPIGTLQGSIEDLQGRFNLNDLGRNLSPGKPDPVPLAIFQRLLVGVGLEAQWADMARDWIDADDQPNGSDGAEDAVYTSQTPPYRTGNFPMLSPTELMNLPGFGADRYRKIAPYVTALPDITAINVCTAPDKVLQSLTPNLGGELSNPDVLIAGRKAGCFPDRRTLQNMAGGEYAGIKELVAENSSFFRLTTRVTLGTTEFTLYSLLNQPADSKKVTTLLRTFGTT